jgi:hypothetical protein
MHRFAKQTVGSWLRLRSKVGANYKGLNPLLPVLPLLDRSFSPMFGVYEEYPICKTADGQLIGLHISWDDWRQVQTTKMKVSKQHGIPSQSDIQNWNQLAQKDGKLSMEWFFDVGVVDASKKLCCVCEIVHKNHMDDTKINWLNENKVSYVEMNAEWIMTRVKPPFDMTEGIMRSNLINDHN